jgi:hypothetical protein
LTICKKDISSYYLFSTIEKALQQEFEWAAHLGLSSIMLPVPNPPFENYARFTHRYLLRCTYLQMWIRIPLSVVCILFFIFNFFFEFFLTDLISEPCRRHLAVVE